MNNTTRITTTVLILLLGFLALFFGIKYNQLKKELKNQNQVNVELNSEYDDLNSEFAALQEEFKELEDSTLVLNQELEEQRQSLLDQKDKVAALIRSGNLSKKQLSDARLTIASLRDDKNVLIQKVQQLEQENVALKEQNKNYSLTLNDFSQKNEQLSQQNENLSNEKQELEQKAVQDAPKVAYAQVVQVKNVSSHGVKYRNSGKEVETRNHKKVDKIKVNFTSEVNPVTPKGNLEYVVRIISPDGTVVYDQQRGSGVFNGSAENKNMKYTTKTTVDYEGEEKNISLFWRQDSGYPEGNYQVEVYNRGYLVGKSGFELR